jgi:hypothetical protein
MRNKYNITTLKYIALIAQRDKQSQYRTKSPRIFHWLFRTPILIRICFQLIRLD